MGRVDVHGLWMWRQLEGQYEDLFEKFPRHPAVKIGNEQWWNHEPGDEFLAANPVDIPGLAVLLDGLRRTTQSVEGMRPWNVNDGVFLRNYKGPEDAYATLHCTFPPCPPSPSDPFTKLPTELAYMVANYLSSKDIAHLRLVTKTFLQLPNIMFRGFLLQDMPWLWEAREFPQAEMDWFQLYRMVKVSWGNLAGLRNRKRIWRDVWEVVGRIERFREQGKIREDDLNVMDV